MRTVDFVTRLCLPLAALWIAPGCGSSTEGAGGRSTEDAGGLSKDTGIREVSISSSGDNVTSASIDLVEDGDEQDFLVTLTPIVDPLDERPLGAMDSGRVEVSSSVVDGTGDVTASLTVKQSGPPGETCDAVLEFGAGTASGADVAFLVDTTGSMGSAVTGIADSIEAFAEELDDAGLGVRFSFVTFGDAYNTRRSVGSGYTLGTGADEPPVMDPIERPMMDFTSRLVDFGSFVDEVRTNVGSGAGGNDSPENYYGVAAAMNAKSSNALGGAGSPLSRRSDVPYYQVLVGDDCGHSEEYPGLTADTAWLPPSELDLGTVLGDGSVTIHTVEREGFESDVRCLEEQVTLDEISDATGGAKLTFPATGEVDLSAINLAEFITNFWLVKIDSECIPTGTERVILELVVSVDDGASIRTQAFTFAMTLGPNTAGKRTALVSAL